MADPLSAHSHRHRGRRREKRDFAKIGALSVFALLVTLAPLAFGAVDRMVQIALVALLGVGMLAVPPRIVALPVWFSRALAVLAAVLLLKEIVPATWFGAVSWRTTLSQAYGLALPWTHHPELGHAIDGWLAAAVAVLAFAWVRTLAAEREDRTRLAWILFASAVLVAVVSFVSAGAGTKMIFGLRYTPGWFGFGPFPNRNHSACYFAIAAVVGAGVLARSAERKHFGLLATSAVMLVVLLLALLRTQSRGGILALGAGLAVFFAVVLLKLRSRQSLAVAIASALLVAGLGLVAGGKTLQRIAGTGSVADDSASARAEVWRNAAAMWRDAPLFGHGLGAFESIFPMYQQLTMEEVRVKHPESSVLQWLDELGLAPTLFAGLLLLAFALPHVGSLFERRSSFLVRAACFGGTAVLFAHAIFDVPAHRWGTAGVALVAFAIACPASPEARRAPRLAALVPLGIAGLWLMPICLEKPAWSTFQLDRVIARQAIPPGVPAAELQASLRSFPLNPQLHFAMGERLLRTGALPPSRWQNELRIAVRLVPNSWEMCARAARLCRAAQPSLAIHYWQLAVERATRQRVDVFGRAVRETTGLPESADAWSSYVEAHPDLALLLSEQSPDDVGRRYYEVWWADRGASATAVTDAEAAAFIRAAPRWGTPAQLEEWMRRHPERSASDFRGWAAVLNAWHEDEKAWELLRRGIPEPAYPPVLPRLKREDLGFLWRNNPEDIVNARSYAHLLEHLGENDESEAVVLAVAERAGAPKWFLEKAAHQLARKKEFAKAVELALRAPAVLPQ